MARARARSKISLERKAEFHYAWNNVGNELRTFRDGIQRLTNSLITSHLCKMPTIVQSSIKITTVKFIYMFLK